MRKICRNSIAGTKHLDSDNRIEGSKLDDRMSEKKIGALKNVLGKDKGVFPIHHGATSLIESDVELFDENPKNFGPIVCRLAKTELGKRRF